MTRSLGRCVLVGATILCASSAFAGIVHFGLDHSALGDAVLQVDGGNLTVSNLGSERNGVSIRMPANAAEWNADWLDLDPFRSAPVGAFIESIALGSIGSQQNVQPVVTLRSTKRDGFLELGATFFGETPNSPHTVSVFNLGSLVYEVMGFSGTVDTTTVTGAIRWPGDWHSEGSGCSETCGQHGHVGKATWRGFSNGGGNGIAMRIGETTVIGDELVFSELDPSTPRDLVVFKSVALRTQGIPRIVFTNETVTLNSVPEPSTLPLLGWGALLLAAAGLRQRIKASPKSA